MRAANDDLPSSEDEVKMPSEPPKRGKLKAKVRKPTLTATRATPIVDPTAASQTEACIFPASSERIHAFEAASNDVRGIAYKPQQDPLRAPRITIQNTPTLFHAHRRPGVAEIGPIYCENPAPASTNGNLPGKNHCFLTEKKKCFQCPWSLDEVPKKFVFYDVSPTCDNATLGN